MKLPTEFILFIAHRNHPIYSQQIIAVTSVVQMEHVDGSYECDCESTSNNWPERYSFGSLVIHQYVYITYVLCSGSILGHRSFYRTPNADNFLPGKIRERHPSSSQTNPEWRPEIEKGWIKWEAQIYSHVEKLWYSVILTKNKIRKNREMTSTEGLFIRHSDQQPGFLQVRILSAIK